jgi:hypothetical protein
MKEIYKRIETWNENEISQILEECKSDKTLKKELLERYEGVLSGLNKKTLASLTGLDIQWKKMNVQKPWNLIYHWPEGMNFLTESVVLEGVGANQANHEEWVKNGITEIGPEIGKLKM